MSATAPTKPLITGGAALPVSGFAVLTVIVSMVIPAIARRLAA